MLKRFFKEKLIFLQKEKNKNFLKIFSVDDVYEMPKENFFFKTLNKLLGNKLREKRYNRKINKFLPDIIILGFPNEINYIENKKIKKFLVQHTNYEMFIKKFCNNNLKLVEKLKKELDMFIFLSEYDKEKFIKELNFPIKKIRVIRHSCEIELLKEKKEKNKELIMIARLENETKRFDLAIKAMKKLSDFTLNIYGDGKDRGYLENLIKENNLNNVILYGGTNKVKEKLDEVGIFIMTSDFEGYPISTIEAMRRGLPIILRNTFEAAQDIVIDNGILLEKKWNEENFIEAVRKVYNNYKFYSENSIKQGKRYDLKKIENEWQNLMQNLENEKEY